MTAPPCTADPHSHNWTIASHIQLSLPDLEGYVQRHLVWACRWCGQTGEGWIYLHASEPIPRPGAWQTLLAQRVQEGGDYVPQWHAQQRQARQAAAIRQRLTPGLAP